MRSVMLGDKNARVDRATSQPVPTNRNEASLGQRGSRADFISRNDIVSGDTSTWGISRAPITRSTTCAAYLPNRSHSPVVGVWVMD